MYVPLRLARLPFGVHLLIIRAVASRPHAPQLPPIQSNMSPESFYPQSATAQLNAVYNREARSPRTSTNPNPPQQQLPPGGGPVPKFQPVKNTADLQPKINQQPPFRRANPEGGFISVSRLSETHGFMLTV
jgi:dual specificity protein kinase YAK1